MPERRRVARWRPRGLMARIRPGHEVLVVNVSADGALLDAPTPLRPGGGVEVQFERGDHRLRMSGTVVRCSVTALDPHLGPIYRAAVVFDGTFDWSGKPRPMTGIECPTTSTPMTGRGSAA